MTKVGELEKKKRKDFRENARKIESYKESGSRRENKSKRDFRDSREQKQNIKDYQVSLLCTSLFLSYHTTFFFLLCLVGICCSDVRIKEHIDSN